MLTNQIRRTVSSRSSIVSRLFSTTVAQQDKTTFKHSELEITLTKQKKEMPAPDTLQFGKYFTDHMLEVEWDQETGWGKPRIVPYHNLELSPSCTVFHYALECFEGLKAYHDMKKGSDRTLLFRPDMNAKRMATSCARLGLPTFDDKEFVKLVAELVKVEKDWLPQKKGYSLYVRPTCISTDPTLGVAPARKALFYCIISPVGPYFKSGFAPVKLLANPSYVRAFPGGTGGYKVGLNYAPTILPQLEAQKKGYSQCLWLFGPNYEIAEGYVTTALAAR